MNTEHQSKPKLAWPMCPKSMKLIQKWLMSNDLKMLFLLGYNLKLGITCDNNSNSNWIIICSSSEKW